MKIGLVVSVLTLLTHRILSSIYNQEIVLGQERSRLIYLGAIIILIFSYRLTQAKTPLLLLIGGGIINLLDIIQYKGVKDYLNFPGFGFSWSTFNLADVLIIVGLVWFLIKSFAGNRIKIKP